MVLSAALGRSRSGQGGHVLPFFDEAVSAVLARRSQSASPNNSDL